MALSFPCNHCNESIIVRYLEIGEIAECANCAKRSTVPANASPIDATEYTRPLASKKFSKTNQTEEMSWFLFITEILRVLGIALNGFVLIVFAIAISNPISFDLEWIVQALALLTSASTIYALVSLNNRYIKVAIVANMVVSILLGIFISVYGRYYSIIIGMLMVMQGLASILSLAINCKRSLSKS